MKLRWALLPAALCAVQAHAQPVEVNLPAGKLGDAVAMLGRQTSISVSIASGSLWGRRVRAVRGRMSDAEALRRMLADTGAVAVPLGPGAWRIEEKRTPPARAVPTPRPTPPVSQEADDAPIIVTASKRDTRIERFAGSVHMLDGADFTFGGENGTNGILARIATLSSTHLGSGRNKLFIRGIADSSFTGPTQATVGQYLGDLRLTYNAPDPDLRLQDIGAVEILEGPQGTLYGAGSLGGVIRLIPNAPELEDAFGSISAGASLTQHGAPGGDVSGIANLPIVADMVGLRLVGYHITEGGYIDDVVRDRRDINRNRVSGGRATLRIAPGDGWTVDLGGIIQNNEGRDNQYADPDLPPLTRGAQADGGFDARYRLGSAVVEKKWDALSFLSSTAYVSQRLNERYDASTIKSGPVLFRQDNRTRMFSTENRLSHSDDGGFGWVVGFSHIRNITSLGRSLGPPDMLLPLTGVTNKVRETTVYGEGSVTLMPRLQLTAGARYSQTELSGSGEDVLPTFARLGVAITRSRIEKRVLPSAAISAELFPGTVFYTRYQQGFRPGGLAVEGDFVRQFRNDRVMTMESGIRHRPKNGPIALSANIAYTEWKDIQADFIDEAGLPSTENIGDGRIWSVSFAATLRPIRGLSIDASMAFNDSKVTQPAPALIAALAAGSLRGFPQAVPPALAAAASTTVATIERIPNVARITARGGFDYRTEIWDGTAELRLGGWVHYISQSQLGIGPVLGESQGNYVDSALTLRIGRPGFGVTVGVTNLADTIGNRFALGTPFGVGAGRHITPLRPRTLRIGIDRAF